MNFPFVTRSHHEELVSELRRQLTEKEAERQKCWDLLSQMGFGTKVFDLKREESEDEESSIQTPDIPLGHLRPSQIMRKMDREKQREYEDKNRLARKAEIFGEVAAIINGKPAN